MDKLAAYRILGLEEGASIERIKEVYASLSKEYHPEENPEEFQLLHEAYVTLTRGNRRQQRFVAEESTLAQITREEKARNESVFAQTSKEHAKKNDDFEAIQQFEEESDEGRGNALNFAKSIGLAEKQMEDIPVSGEDAKKAQTLAYARSIHEAQKQQLDESDTVPQYDFEASVEQAQKEEEQKLWRVGRQLADELDAMFSSANYNNVKKMKAFFSRKELKNALFSEVFIESLARQLEETPVKPAIYSFLIQFYQLKDKNLERLIPVAQRLYHAIDSRYSVVKDNYATQRNNVRIGLGAGVVGGLVSSGRTLLKYFPKIFRPYFNGGDVSVFIPFAIMIVGGFLIYKFFAKRTSSYLAQSVVAALLFMISMLDLAFGIWKPFFEASGNDYVVISVYMGIVSIIWLAIAWKKFSAEEKENSK